MSLINKVSEIDVNTLPNMHVTPHSLTNNKRPQSGKGRIVIKNSIKLKIKYGTKFIIPSFGTELFQIGSNDFSACIFNGIVEIPALTIYYTNTKCSIFHELKLDDEFYCEENLNVIIPKNTLINYNGKELILTKAQQVILI